MAVAANEWLELTQREYLRLFVPGGGSAIKFALADEPLLREVHGRLEVLARQRLLHFVTIDAAVVKLHMIQDVFFAIARDIDWDTLAQRWVEVIFRKYDYTWPRPGEAVPLREIAEANGLTENLLSRTVQQWLTKHIMRDRDMAQDFRAAMTHLCMRRMQLTDVREVAPVLEWLGGTLRTISAVQKVPINSKINRHNGRAMLRSLCHWLHLSGGPGLAVLLDLRQIGRHVPAGGEGVRYTPAAVLDAFEVLRQLVDDADSFERFFVAATSDPGFVDSDSKRSVDRYRALKERIWSDVHARGHENPLAPLLQLSTTAAHGDAVGQTDTPGDMPYSEERVAIEALRAGVPNRPAIRLLGTSEHELCDRFVNRLHRTRNPTDDVHVAPGELVAGDFGSGKSHLLGYLAEQALRENFIVSIVAISKETPLFQPERVFAAAARNAMVPGINDDVMTAVVSHLKPGSAAYADLEAWASGEQSGLSPVFAALLYLIPRVTTSPEEIAAIARFFAGAKLSVSKVRQWLKAAGVPRLFPLASVKAPELALQRIRFAPRLFAAAGFGGWCVLMDEIELIGRYSPLQRGKSYAELCRWLGLNSELGTPGMIGLGAITTDFVDEVLHNRLDQEKISGVLRAKGLDRQARWAEAAMQLIERQETRLKAPDDMGLRQCHERVRELYARSYGVVPPPGGIGTRAVGTRMRHHIKSWITDWDIQRLYGAKDEITTNILEADYTENPDLEHVSEHAEAEEDAA